MTDTCEKHCEAKAFKIVIRGLEGEVARLKERLAQEKALQALHDENERLGLYRDAYAEPMAHDPLPRACNLAGVDYQTFLKIKAYMPVYDTTPPKENT